MTGTVKTNLDKAKTSASDAMDVASDTANEAMGEVKSTVAAHRGAFATHTADAIHAVRDAAAAGLEGARETVAATGERVADTLRSTAEKASAAQARLGDVVSSGLHDVANTLRNRSVGDLAGDVKAMAQRNPALFAAGVAVAGLALARLLRPSARQEAAAEQRVIDRTAQFYRDAARRTATTLGQPDTGARS